MARADGTRPNEGRPTKLTDDVRQAVASYIKMCIDESNVPTIARLAVNLNVSKKTLYNWGDKDKEFLHTLDIIQSIQEALLVEGSLKGQLNAAISKLMLANHGYREKSEQDITSGGEALQPLLVRFIGDDGTNPK